MEAEKARQEQLAAQQTEQAGSAGQANTAPAPGSASGNVSATSAGVVPLTPQDALSQSVRIEIDTPKLSGSLNLTGARIDDLHLKDYRETLDEDSPTITLLSPSGTQQPYYAEFGWVSGSGDLALPDANTVWTRAGRCQADH